MKNRKKELHKITVLLILAVLFLSACGNNKEETQDAAQEISENAPVQTETETAEGEESSVTDAEGMPESVMDVICAANGIAAMNDGSLLVTDTYSKILWQVQTHNGISTVYAGSETDVTDLYGEPIGGYNDASTETSYFQCPWAIAPFLEGWAVSDTDNNAVRLVTKTDVQTVNGSTSERLTVGDLGVVFERPTGLASDEDGNLYVSDTGNGAIRKITPEGKVTTEAKGLEDPMGLCWKDGILYAAETGANRIVMIENGNIEPIAGSGDSGYLDGSAEEAAFCFPEGVTVDDNGIIYVADTGNSAVRLIKEGKTETLFVRDRTSLELSPVSPVGLLVQGNELYVCDNFARKVLRVMIE